MILSPYSNTELERIIQLVKQKIRFIDPIFIKKSHLLMAEELAKDVDIDDTEFVPSRLRDKDALIEVLRKG